MPNLTPSPDLVQSLDMAEVAATRPSARGTRPVGRGAARPEEAPAAPAPPSPARRASDEAEAAQWAKVRAAVETLPDFRATAPGREADDRGEFRKGAEGALSSLVSGIRLLASQDDDAEFTEALIDYQVEAERNAPKVGSYTEIDDGSSFGDYVAYNLGQGGASILTSIAGGGLGGAAVKAGVKKLAAGVVEKYVAKGYAKDVAETLAKKAIARTVARAGAAGQYAGAGVASSPMLLTETISGMAENGDVDMGAAALAVAAKATLDALPVFNIMRRAGVPDTLKREIQEKAASRFMKAAGDGLKDMTLEGMTEGAQSYVDQITVESVANGELTLPVPEAEEIINSFLAGAIGAGGPSLASSVIGAARSGARPTSVHVLAAQHPDVPHFKKASEIANKAVQAYQKGNTVEGASFVVQAEQLKAEGEKAVRRAQFAEKEAAKREAARAAKPAQAPQAEAPQAEAPQAEAPQAEAPQAEAPQAEAPQVGPVRPTTRDIIQPNGPMPRVWRSPSSGKPFRNEKVAEAYRKAARLGPQTEVQPAVGGGFEVVSIEPRVWRSPTTGEPFRTERAARAYRDVTLGDVPGLAVRKTGGGFEVAPAGAAPTTPADAAPVAPADAAPAAPATSEPVFTLNKAGKPYRTKEAAQVAINMGREGLGENARVVPYAGGFAILSDPKLAPAEAVKVKPAVRRERALNAKGNPYTTERAARAALGFRKAGVGANPAVVPVDGGYAIEYDAPETAAPVDTAPPLRTVRKVRASGKGYASEKSAANAAKARKDIPPDHRIVPYEDGGFAIEYDEPGEAAPAKPADAPKADAPAAVDEKTGKARVDEVARSMVSRLNKQGSRLRLATKAPSDPESRAAESLAEVFGLHLRWVSNAPGKRRQIVSGAISGNVMLLNKQSSWPARAVVGHELVHRMRQQAPDLYSEVNAALTESLRRVQFDARGLERGMADVYRMKVGSDSLREEVVADLFGAEFTNPALYDLIAPNDPGLVAKVLRFIRDVLIQIKEEIGAFRGGRLSDVPQMDDWTKVVADTLKKYEKRVAVAKDNGGMKTQVTWHGSPHKWDRPDISKVGTGEGAQAYGYGFYSAEAEGVAEGYKKDLSGFEEPAIQTPSSIKSGSELDDTDLSVIRYLEFGQKDAGQFPHNTVYYAKKRAEAEGDSQALARLDEYGREARVVRRKNTGHLYKLDIPDEDIAKYLDWDKPLNEQSEAIQRAAVDIERAYWSAPAASKTVSMDEAFGGMSESDWLRSMSGEDLVEYLGDLLDDADVAGSRAHAVTKAAGLSGDVYANIAASGVLNAHGVPGIKYLDNASRSAGEGTRNYVTFDPSRIKVLDRNGEQVGTADEFPELDSRQQAADAEMKTQIEEIPETITVDGKQRPTQNSNGDPIHPTLGGIENFWRWFGDSKVVDSEGRPLVVYHGSPTAGFDEFDTKGGNDPGAFFSDSRRVAISYGGSRDDAVLPLADAKAAFAELKATGTLGGYDVRLTPQFTVVDEYGDPAIRGTYESEEELLDAYELDDGDVVVERYELVIDGYANGFAMTEDEVMAELEDMESMSSPAPGVYAAYVSLQDPLDVDFQGNNWDDGPKEKVWEVWDEGRDIVDILYDEASAAAYRREHPEFTVEETLRPVFGWDTGSTREVVREAQDMDTDGVVFRNVVDSGPKGDAYEESTVVVAFRPEQIKSATDNRGTFSPTDARIQFSLQEAGEQRQLRAARTLGIVEEDVRQGPDPKFSAQDAEAETAAWWKRYGGEKPRAAAWERVKKVMRRWATKEGLGNDWTFQRNVQREAGIRAGRQWYHVLATKLQDTVAAEYPAGAPADLSGRISDALHGRGPSDLPRPVMQVIKELRAHLDKMSTQFAGQLDENVYAFTRQAVDAYSRGDKTAMDAAFLAAAESENLAKIIRSNRGEYLHRSYQMFDDAGYAPTDEVRSAAVAAIAERTLALRAELQKRIDAGTATDLQKNRVAHIDEIGADTLAEATVREILAYGREAADSSSGDFASMLMGKVGSMNVDALKQRDDSILPEVRALMGEYTDPVVNYQRTADNLVRLTENNAFLIALREQGLASGWFSEFSGENPEHDEKVAPGGSKVYRPLAGLYTSHDMNVALSDVMDDTYAGGWARAMIATAGTVKLFKTVANPPTHFHNFASSGLIAAFNGHFSPKRVIAAGKLYRAYIHDRGDLTKLVNEMLELGIFGSAADASELQKMLEDFGRSSHQWARDAHAGKSIQLARSIWDWTKRHYMGEDDFWKFVGFQAEFERISKREGVSEAEAKKLAAERIQNLYPNYDFVPKWVRALRRFPITSTFISFPYEMARTYINQYRYLEEDFKAGRMNEVYPRVAGLLTSASFAWAIAVTSRAIFGVDDDEEESIYEMAPEWQRNSNFLFLGRDENGNPTAIDLSYLDPMASWRRPIVALYRQAVRGGEVADVAAESAWEVFRTFGDWDMTFRAFVNAISGVDENGAPIYAKQADPGDKVVSAVAYMSDKLKPGVLDTGWRFWKAANEEVSSSGKQYTIGDESLALFGVRTTTFDPKVSLFYRAYEFADAKRAAAGALTSVARNPNRVSDDALRSALQQSLDYRRDTYEKVARLIRAARSGGMTADQIRAVLKAQRISDDDVNYLLKGEMAPWKPKTSVLRSAIKKAEVLFGEEVAKEFQRRDLFLTREMAGVQ